MAREIAIQEDADAIVTGEIIGKQASHTTAILRAIENAVTDFPILRPNAGNDTIDIERLAKQIGTHEFVEESTSCCSLNSKSTSESFDPDQIASYEESMDFSVLKEELKSARIMVLREGK